MTATVTLRLVRGRLESTEDEFAARTNRGLRRADDCAPRLPDDGDHRTVSRHHCLLDINPPDARIRDFGSLNGTFVNGVKIGQRRPGQSPEEAGHDRFPELDLKDGDEIVLGNTAIHVTITVPRHCEDCGRELPPGA